MSPAQQPSRTRLNRTASAAGSARSFLFAALLAFSGGCGAPGEPTPPIPPVALAVSNLAAHQRGEAVELSFALPVKTVDGDRLKEAPAVEVLRVPAKPDGSADLQHLEVVSTIPGALVPNYVTNGVVQLTVPIAADELRSGGGRKLIYLVRTRASRKRASANSNPAGVTVFPAAEPITGLAANLTESAVELQWRAPEKTVTGDPIPQGRTYQIYRGEIAAAADQREMKWTSLPVPLATTDQNQYRDTSFAFGKTYVYTVRTVLPWDGNSVESADSGPVTVAARDVFPPGAPQDVVASVARNPASGDFEVELSWAINGETDLAGYRVYRSEQEGTAGGLITPSILLTPALRDTTVKPGHRYWYTVTAVDAAQNESQPSVAIRVDVAQPSP